MRLIIFLLFAQASLWTEAVPKDAEKELIMLEIEPLGDRSKRSPAEKTERVSRQNPSIPPEYLNLYQQLSPQQAAQQQRIQELVVTRDGKQPTAARFVLSPDGKSFLQAGSPFSGFQQTPQFVFQQPGQQQFVLQQPGQGQGPPQQLPSLEELARPAISPELQAFSEAQTRLQQDYHDAPIRAQIAGFVEARPQAQANPAPQGPESAAPQVFSPAPGRRPAFQSPTFGGQIQIADPAFLQQFAQQAFIPQPAFAQGPQTVASADTGRQLGVFPQAPRDAVVYQSGRQSQPRQEQKYQPKQPAPPTRKPESAGSQLAPSTQPQLLESPQQLSSSAFLQQEIPQQFLVDPSRQSASPQIRYAEAQQPDLSAFFAGTPGRGLFSPEKTPSRPVFLTQAKTQLPTVRIPTPTNQRPLSRAEFDALVQAGFSITPVGSEEPQQSLLKSKRTPPPRRNHVVYSNEADGVQYQYSPGSSEYNPQHKSKRFAPKEPVYKADSPSGVQTYVVALEKPEA